MKRMGAINTRLRELDPQKALGRTLTWLSREASRTVPRLDVERPEDPLSLSIKKLTVTVSDEKRDDFLWEVGSGAN